MKKARALWVVVFFATACIASRRLPTHVAPDLLEVAWDDRSAFREGLIETERSVLDDLSGATVYHIDLTISADMQHLQGSELVRYTNCENVPLEQVYFRLFPNVTGGEVTVSTVKVDGQRVTPVYEFVDTVVRVPLPGVLQPNDQIVIEMDFEVRVALEMGGNYGLFGYFDDVLVLDEFYPAVAVHDQVGWNVEIPSRNGDLTYYDASFYLVRVTAPAKLVIGASGVEVGREYKGRNQVVTFAAGPARDFYIAASERYEVISERVGETTVRSFAFKDHTKHAELALQYAINALNSFNTRFGLYPYTELDVLSTPMTIALGIEYPGAIGISVSMYDPDYDFGGVPSRIYLESVVAHEVGHQWFYNMVGNDQVDEPWLDEAVTQYATWLYYVDTYGENNAEGYRNSWQDRWARVDYAAMPIGLSTDGYEGNEYGAIVYGRGPLFVTALAEEMGQETFDAFLRDYVETSKWNIGTGQAFWELAEAYCQCDLTGLFETWVYGP